MSEESNSGSAEVEGSPQPEQLPPDVEMTSASQQDKPSYEGLQDEVKTLKATVERLQQSLAKKDERILKLKRAMKDTIVEFWQEEAEELHQTVHKLKMSMEQAQVGKEAREKEEEVRKLTKKVARLRERDEQQPKSADLKVTPAEVELHAKAKAMSMQQGGGASATGQRTAVAVAILPEEVWRMVLENLTDPRDLWNSCNTCQLFETILRPWKTGWMMEQALPYLYRHLPGKKLLECRQVSKGWNAAVTSYLENHPSILPCKADRDPRDMDGVYPVKEKGIGNRNLFTFGPGEDLSMLEELFPKKLGRNPFIGRYVIFNLRTPNSVHEDTLEVEEQRYAKLYDFLETYGKEIWNLALYFPVWPGAQAKERVIELLTSRLFPLVPNLRKLFTTWTGCDMDTPIDREQLPPAPNLRTLQSDRVDEDVIFDALIRRYHLQLEVLHLGEYAWELVYNLEWPNLKELVLCFGDVLNEDDGIHFGRLYGLRMPQLNRLTLSFEEFYGLHLIRLVEAINGLTVTTSLNSFRLVAAGPFKDVEFEQLDTNYIVSESVKTLELINLCSSRNATSLPSHNFLRYFPFIENLVIITRRSHPFDGKYDTEIDLMSNEECRRRAAGLKRVEEVVKVNKYLYKGQMYKSNIWELLPRLKVLTFQWDVYTRENYEAYAKQRASSTSATGEEGSVE